MKRWLYAELVIWRQLEKFDPTEGERIPQFENVWHVEAEEVLADGSREVLFSERIDRGHEASNLHFLGKMGMLGWELVSTLDRKEAREHGESHRNYFIAYTFFFKRPADV